MALGSGGEDPIAKEGQSEALAIRQGRCRTEYAADLSKRTY